MLPDRHLEPWPLLPPDLALVAFSGFLKAWPWCWGRPIAPLEQDPPLQGFLHMASAIFLNGCVQHAPKVAAPDVLFHCEQEYTSPLTPNALPQ